MTIDPEQNVSPQGEQSSTPRWTLDPNGSTAKNNRTVRVKKNYKSRILGSLVALSIGAVLIGSAANNPGQKITYLENGSTVYPPSLSALSYGCTGFIQRPPPNPKEVGWVTQKPAPVWRTVPPVSGNFYKEAWPEPEVLPAGTKKVVKLGQSVAAMYRGWIVVYYRKKAISNEQLSTVIQSTESLAPETKARLLFAPWPYEGLLDWTGSRPWAFSAWGASQECNNFSPTVLDAFAVAHPVGNAPASGLPTSETGPKAKEKAKR